MINVLISGANGFIGSHLCYHLSSKGNINVFGIDLGSQKWTLPAFKYATADIRIPGFEKNLPDVIQVVIHLAQSPMYRQFPDGAQDMMQVNVDGTFRLLEWARKSNVKKFILASTGNVYATSKELLTEKHPCHASSFYAVSKLCAEQIAGQYSNFFKIVVLRLFGVYGPGQQNTLVPNIIGKIISGEKITLAKNAGLYITPVFIKDLVEVIARLVADDLAEDFQALNVAGNEILSLREMAECLSMLLKQSLNTEITQDEPAYLTGSNELLKKMIGSEYISTDFQTGVRVII